MEKFNDVSVNHDAMVEVGDKQIPAKDILCAFLPSALQALEAAKQLVKNPFLKLVIGIVANALESLGESFCPEK